MRILISVLFWITLFAAAFLFGSAVLAPSFAQWHRTQLELLAKQEALLRLERQVRWLRRAVSHASNPSAATGPIEGEHIPMPPTADGRNPGPQQPPRERRRSVHERWLLFVAAHPRLQRRFLLAAALLVLAGFTVLNDPEPAVAAPFPLLRRYWHPPERSASPPARQATRRNESAAGPPGTSDPTD